MATLYLSEADVLRDPAALLAYARDGAEIVIQGKEAFRARLVREDQQEEQEDPEYEAWFLRQIDEALAHPGERIDSATMEAHFAERRRLSALRLTGVVG